MGFLDKKERILDIQLTDKGRDLLSKGNLNFSFYAFSDNNIDYSGSLSASMTLSGTTYEKQIEQTLTFEADQRKNKKNLESYLFTIPSTETVLPEFRTSLDPFLSASLERKYKTTTLKEITKTIQKRPEILGVILRNWSDFAKEYNSDPEKTKDEEFVALQEYARIKQSINNNRSIIGSFLDGYMAVAENTFLNTRTGENISLNDLFAKFEEKTVSINTKITDIVETLVGLERVKIDLRLASGEREIDSPNGFLVEVYFSGSDGKLTRMYQEDVIDILNNDNLVREGFSKYIDLIVDGGDDNE